MTARAQLPVEVAMPNDGPIVIRLASPADLPAVEELYRRLDPDDRYCRFFTGAGASEAFTDRWLTASGGDVVVAVAGARAVGEAGYAVDENGRCQLGITVDRPFRGWLGPYLLDLVLALAGERGHASVVADVLATNRPMLALVAARGYAVLPSDDLSIVRMLLGTSDAVPGWGPRGAHRRALVELGQAGSTATRALIDAGFDVVVCPGPSASRSRRWRCPALGGRRCPLVAGADVVVTTADATRDAAVLDAVRRVHEGVPLCVVSREAGASEIVAAARATAANAVADDDP